MPTERATWRTTRARDAVNTSCGPQNDRNGGHVRAQQRNESIHVERLDETCAARSRGLGEHPVVARDENDGRRVPALHELVLDVEAAHPEKPDIEDNARRRCLMVALEEFLTRCERGDAKSASLQRALERHPKGCVIVDDTDPRLACCRRRRWHRLTGWFRFYRPAG